MASSGTGTGTGTELIFIAGSFGLWGNEIEDNISFA